MATVMLVGMPNVGKSVIFNSLTGAYATVSNYPGTTVDVARGRCQSGGRRCEVIDTPGLYSLQPFTEEERVTCRLLAERRPDLVVHVIDAKNIRRMLHLTLQLIEAGFPVLLNLNMQDEARRAGVRIDTARLEAALGAPVVATAALRGEGMAALRTRISSYRAAEAPAKKQPQAFEGPPGAEALIERQRRVDQILDGVIWRERRGPDAAARLERYLRQPWTAVPILLLVLYFGLYQLVGRFGAGTLVDWIDGRLFGAFVTPAAQSLAARLPWPWLTDLLVGEYGLYTLGVRYAAAIVLPVVGTFFLMFALLEDSGYLPRLAMLTDRVCKCFGLNGRAVIPLTLGLGCGTMAVVVTRTLASRRERVLATFLLALAVPCSAQLGVIMALLSPYGALTAVWLGTVALVFVLAGTAADRLLPGAPGPFYMELPPLRPPSWRNALWKAATRVRAYFGEILPVFLLLSLFLWLLEQCGLLRQLTAALTPALVLIGLPAAAAPVFLLGFFRRDYGAAGLYTLCLQGALREEQLLVAAVTLTLFMPCAAQTAVMVKERGAPASLAIAAAVTCLAYGTGLALHSVLLWIGWP